MQYKYTITCTYNYYGYPQAERRYTVSTPYLDFTITWYGNNGFDLPKVTNDHNKCNGYFWSMRLFIETIFFNTAQTRELREKLFSLKENETTDVVLSNE